MKKTLLELAKEHKTKKINRADATDEEIDLAIAWAKDELQAKQIAYVLNIDPNLGSFYLQMSLFLREAVRRGKLKTQNE